jgi:hypothetical protein
MKCQREKLAMRANAMPLHCDGTLAQVRACPELPRLVLRAVVPPGKTAAPMLDDLLAALRGSALGGDVAIRGRSSRAPA